VVKIIIKNFYHIGNAFFEGKAILQILIDLQGSVNPRKNEKTPKLLILEFNISNLNSIEYEIYKEDYDDSKKYEYMLGKTPGTKTNYSLTSSLEWNKKNEKLKINWKKITQIKDKINRNKRIFSKNNDDINWILKLLEFIEKNQEQINESIKEYFIKEEDDLFNYPLIFKIKKEGIDIPQYLGEIEFCRQLYEFLFFVDEGISSPEGGRCFLCRNTESLLNGFNIGLFTVNQHAFRTDFFIVDKKLNFQYLMCKECYVKTLFGYNIAESRLKYYAFSKKIGRNNIAIYHYIIPFITEPASMKDAINLISQSYVGYKKSIQKQISELNNKLTQLDIKKAREEYQKLKKRLEGLEKHIKSNSFNILEFIKNIYRQKKEIIRILDIYFKIEDTKQTPSTKSIISEVFLTNEKIKMLNKLFEGTRDDLGLSDISDVRFDSLLEALEMRDFMHYFTSLYNLNKIKRKSFLQLLKNKIKSLIINDLITTEHSWTFNNVIEAIRTYDYLIDKANLWI